ncbi:hypothetical protein GGF40_004330 [Coemansia sp. RSA 1286]|nr:hypothetical protein GGF40_004330 [Coemansia sp. RSA 1286]
MHSDTALGQSNGRIKRCNSQRLLSATLLLASLYGMALPVFAGVLPSLVPGSGVLSQFEAGQSAEPVASGAGQPSVVSSMPPVETDLDQASSLVDRQGEGTVRFSSSDTLSDTKIFVLLAAIVFIFLVALGVAMARVSRNRSRQQNERVRQQIVAAQRQPETLNKTILDLLPVYEVTEKRQLRLLHTSPSPRLAMDECFLDNCRECASSRRSNELACNSEGSMVKMRADDIDALAGGYDLESVSSVPYLTCSADGMLAENATGSKIGRPECNEAGDVELMEWLPDRGCANMPGNWSGIQCKRRSPSSIEPPLPVAAMSSRFPVSRFSRATGSYSVSPSASASTRHSSAGYLHNEQQLVSSNHGVFINTGSVLYHDRSSRSRSLDLSSGREVSTESRSTTRDPEPAWLAYSSQPAIARCQSRRSMAASDNGTGLGACPICLEEFDVGEHVRELPCKHKYHVICIDTWLVSRSTCCPYCKLDIRRWYYGPSLEDGLTRPGSLVNTSGQQLGFTANSLLANLPDDSNGQNTNLRRLERIRRRRRARGSARERRGNSSRGEGAGPSNYNHNASRWDRMWLALTATSATGMGHAHI